MDKAKTSQKQIRALLGALLALFASLSAALACTFQFGGTVSTPVGTPTWSLDFIAPENNSLIMVGTTITLAAVASESNGGVARIDFRVDGVLIGSQVAPMPGGQARFSAQQPWRPSEPRGYLITAEAFRADGSSIGEVGIAVQAVAASTAQAALRNTIAPTQTPRTLTPTALPTFEIVGTPIALNTPTPSPTAAEPTSARDAPRLRVTFDFLNVRARPDASSTQIGRLVRGDEALIIGRNAQRTWWAIERGALRGWVINNPEWIQISGETADVPLATTTDDLPTATPSPLPPGGVAPTSTVAGTADLIILSATIVGGTPKVNQTFNVLITVRNQGTVDAGSSLMEGIFQPDGERSQLAVPPIPAGTSVTLPPMPVTLRTSGANLIGTLTLDIKNEVAEGAIGEANNIFTITYNVE
ncbi:MAG: SH3 domain-containing protein [Chloroflexi bacterium]|nr:SH3 domain-containing protein [Chloroflexota bacterium]